MVNRDFNAILKLAILDNRDDLPFKVGDLPNDIETDGMMHQFLGYHYVFREDEDKTVLGRIYVSDDLVYSIKYDVKNIKILKNKKIYYMRKLY